jgi:hypothetical protein
LLDEREEELVSILCPLMYKTVDEGNGNKGERTGQLKIGSHNKLLIANLKMLYIYYLMR